MAPRRKHHRLVRRTIPPNTRHIPQLGHVHRAKVPQQRGRVAIPNVHITRCIGQGEKGARARETDPYLYRRSIQTAPLCPQSSMTQRWRSAR